MPFYSHPTDLISPGDIFPAIPFSISTPPLRILRKSKFTPKAKFGPQDLRRAFKFPTETSELADLALQTKGGEETIASTRSTMAMFLSWGSQVEADERDSDRNGEGRKGWLAAPIFSLLDIPDSAILEDPDTRERLKIREVVRGNLSHNYFYLPAFPGGSEATEHYVDFRKICAIGIAHFRNAKSDRIVTLSENSLNLLFSRLMWFFTRAEYFFEPIQCSTCGTDVVIDVRFHGQNFSAEPWE